ncbi:MAG: phosphatidyl inositol kinase [Watsoniomyces obsoletus]|nr:MAG: phosphatidyl inositol kinase [Watsoniomyces obsoletus]
MADRLTQLQDALDELATQFYASIRYISTNHPSSTLSISADGTTSFSANNNGTQNPVSKGSPASGGAPSPPATDLVSTQSQPPSQPAPRGRKKSKDKGKKKDKDNSPPPPQDPSDINTPPLPTPAQFQLDQRELARDLILKEQQIEYLISVLPGIGTSEVQQLERLRVLERELRDAEVERLKALEEKEEVLERLDGVIRGLRKV